MTRRPLEIVDLGLREYGEVHRLQLEKVEQIRLHADPKDALFLVEHPEVYTFGRKSKETALLFGNAPTFEIERGGEATYHNPGQLVAYPVMKLEDTERDVHLFLRNLEKTLIQCLARYDLASEAVPGATGVWLSQSKRKIASIGVAVRGWVTYHGVALNVANDLSGFQRINPCGFQASIMTSLQQALGPQAPSLDAVKEQFISMFCRVFYRNPSFK